MAAAKAVKLSDIQTWHDHYANKKEELVKLLPKEEEIKKTLIYYVVDSEINEKVSIHEGDITRLQIDGIVSANNSTLVSSGGVSGTINKAAGSALIEELKKLNGCKCGEAMTTQGYNLPVKYIVHTVGPQTEDPQHLKSSYESCLGQMEQKKIKSLAFCCISTGNFGYPNAKAVHVALKTVRQWLELRKANKTLQEIDRVIFCLFTAADKQLYKSWMPVYFPCKSRKECDQQPDGLMMSLTEKMRRLEPLPGFIGISTTEPNMLTLDDDPGSRRAVMPCGHVIGPQSMTEYVQDLVANGKYVFPCPDLNCKAQWSYFLVRHVACLTADEMQLIEKAISNNSLNKSKGMQKCPKCCVWCYREDPNNDCVECPLCTKTNGKRFHFCWICLREWKGGIGKKCGNPECVDERIRFLADCPDKNILGRFVAPSVRGCPKCGLLIEYLEGCTQMHCRGCDHFFCFLCLEGANSKAELKCNPYQSTCKIAPRQTLLPGM